MQGKEWLQQKTAQVYGVVSVVTLGSIWIAWWELRKSRLASQRLVDLLDSSPIPDYPVVIAACANVRINADTCTIVLDAAREIQQYIDTDTYVHECRCTRVKPGDKKSVNKTQNCQTRRIHNRTHMFK